MKKCKKCGRPVGEKAFLCDACRVRIKEGAARAAQVLMGLAGSLAVAIFLRGKKPPPK